ncbi:MAG: tyrosine recombinase [Spirochaetaceae bacterium]|nr:tyrosine recombinase [Spirochaetaceae bacterium]
MVIIDNYIQHITLVQTKSIATVEVYRRELSHFLAYCSDKGFNYQTITLLDIEEYLYQNSYRPATLAKKISALSSFYKYLIRNNLIGDNPVKNLRRPKLYKAKVEALEVAEVDTLLAGEANANPTLQLRDEALFELIYSAGLRVSEAVGLNINDIFFNEGLIRVVGKGDKERVVPLGELAFAKLKTYLTTGRPALKKMGSGNALFLNFNGNRLSRKGIWFKLQQLELASGVTSKTHTLRHSFATHLLAGGADLRVVQELLGHANLTTTEIYTHLNHKELAEVHHKHHPRNTDGE